MDSFSSCCSYLSAFYDHRGNSLRQYEMSALIAVLILIPGFAILRLTYVLWQIHKRSKSRRENKPARTLIILGSGGHTAEMLTIVNELNKDNYTPRFYVVANTDKTSEEKARSVESVLGVRSDFEVFRIKRSREVKQSFTSAVWTTLESILQCIPLVYRLQPDLILCNGPGTCIPICLIAFVLNLLFINTECRIVFVESYCRIKTISLSGKILIWFTDMFVVQWPQLANYSKRTQYFGRLL